MAFLSIAGLYAFDNTIFDTLELPDGVDRNSLVFNLLAELAELEVIYPNSDFMKKAVEMWSKSNFNAWQKIYNTTILEYNPIENYDRKEDFEDSGHAISRVAAFNESELTPAGDGDTTTRRTGRIHGNIGVTTTQQMIEEERRIVTYTFTDFFINEFKKRFCIMVY